MSVWPLASEASFCIVALGASYLGSTLLLPTEKEVMLCLFALSASLSSREVEKQHEESGERLAAAAKAVYETHKTATAKCGEAAVPVLKQTIQVCASHPRHLPAVS